jgi:preprotein translocase subunit SecA
VIKRVHETGQPVLVGTSSVSESEQLAEELKKAGVTCCVLNAKMMKWSQIIARAESLEQVTVSTNMAGRGVDIKIGEKRNRTGTGWPH